MAINRLLLPSYANGVSSVIVVHPALNVTVPLYTMSEAVRAS